jgi:hypothetical protein
MPPEKKKNSSSAKSPKLWVRKVNTESTFPREGLFKKDARTIARVLGSHKVSPKGKGSAVRMLQYFINRGGKNLPESRRRVLERAKRLLQEEKAGKTSRAKAS